MTEQLKPCPFCGGEASVIGIRDGRQVSCKGHHRQPCFAKGPAVYHGPGGWDACEAEAITAWNTRAALTAANVADWQPIETAPKDGAAFDAWIPDAFGGHRMCNLSFNWRGKLRQHGLLTEAEMPRWPTHWRPLPDPPALAGQS